MQPIKQTLTLNQRVKLIVISTLAFCVTVACSVWDRRVRKGRVMCYEPVAITETPEVMCYEVMASTPTPEAPTPEALCYTVIPTPEEATPTPTPMCYTATPSPTATPTPAVEDADTLLERLLAAGRFPEDVARELEA